MIYISDFFALALVLILYLFYLEGRRPGAYFDKASKYFVHSLVFTAATTLIDIAAVELMEHPETPLWLNMLCNSLYFLLNIIATSCIALFLFTKILEHTYDDHCMRNARRGLAVLLVFYSGVVLSNPWTGLLFYFDAAGAYCRGRLNVLGYLVTLCQMILVLICYSRNRKNADKAMRRVLVLLFPVVVICIVIQRIYPQIMLNGIIMAMALTVLFLTFQGQRQGVHNLTRLNDRHRFFKETEERISAGERFQFFRINLKDFAVINQKYGHLLGDEVLYQFAFALEKLIRGSCAYHMNGTVFALAIPYTGEAAASANRERVQRFLEEGIFCLEECIHPDYVLVEYLSDETAEESGEFYEKLEYATQLGLQQKLRYLRYEPEMGRQMHRTRYLIERLRKVDREHGFQVWYQPIRCQQSNAFCSMEALLRLFEPDGSIISPAEFIPLAEQTGMISSVTWFVVEEVCRFLSGNTLGQEVSVSVNLPMYQLLEQDFCIRLNRLVDSYGIRRSRICLEFTEREILENFEQTKAVMEQMTRDGYCFYLDDFGTGYSNFNCLLQLPFRVIKLDISLTKLCCREGENNPLVSTLTGLFHKMGFVVVAEGAETSREVERLVEQGIDRIQGYVYARPMPERNLAEFYREK